MGHTLITHFTPESLKSIEDILYEADALQTCKIPYGRDCERLKADGILPFHITLFHWAKQDDEKYLSCLEAFHFEKACHAQAVNPQMIKGEENSLLLMLNVKPEEDFTAMQKELETVLGCSLTSFLHITLALSKDHEEIRRIYERISKQNIFPLELEIDGLELYHIWKPVKKVRSYMINE